MTFIIGFLLAVNLSHAQETAISDTSMVMRKLQEFSDKTSNIQCGFVQSKTMEFVKEPLVSSGRFYYNAPDKIRWDQNVPYEYIILISGEVMQLKNHGKVKTHNLEKSRAMGAFRDVLLGIINGDILKDKEFSIAYLETSEEYILHLTPRSRVGKQHFSLIKLSFNKADMSLNSISLNDQEGDQTLITFTNPVFNQAIEADRFTKFQE